MLAITITLYVIIAPHVGAWIEMILTIRSITHTTIAPHVGAWIEIIKQLAKSGLDAYRTSRRCVD